MGTARSNKTILIDEVDPSKRIKSWSSLKVALYLGNDVKLRTEKKSCRFTETDSEIGINLNYAMSEYDIIYNIVQHKHPQLLKRYRYDGNERINNAFNNI